MSLQMSPRIAASLLVFTLLPGCGCPTRGSGVRTDDVRDVAAFTTVDADDSIDVFVRAGEAPTAKVVGDENIVGQVELEVVGDTLHVRTRGSFLTSGPLEVYLTTPTLARIEASGSGDVQAEGIDGGALVIDCSGSGDVQASGRAESVTIAASGSGDVDAASLEAADVEVALSGSGDAKVHATKTLDAALSGSGSLRYRGEPEVEQSVSGSGSIKPL
jgi:hypothetical protein